MVVAACTQYSRNISRYERNCNKSDDDDDDDGGDGDDDGTGPQFLMKSVVNLPGKILIPAEVLPLVVVRNAWWSSKKVV